MLIPIFLIFGIATGIGFGLDRSKQHVIEHAQEIRAQAQLDGRMRYETDYDAREDVLTKEEYCEKMKYGVDVCWKVERSK